MLAYVFWHWPQGGHLEAEYEQSQRAFHAALATSGSDGFQYSVVFRVRGSAPWLSGAPAYVDWYVVDNSAALDALNVAAISGAREGPHAQLTREMGAGAGSLLQLRGEQADVAAARCVTWLVKPRPMPYAEFYSAMQPFNRDGNTLWRRQMVLGPTPEFCLLGSGAVDIPGTFQPLRLELSRIWP
jgi:hypothetical protein